MNGRLTLGENIADNGGLREAFNALKTKEAEIGPSPILADLPELDPHKLFFVSYANVSSLLQRFSVI